MRRPIAILLALFCFILFAIIAYMGVKLRILSSLCFGLLVSLVLLNLFYPPIELASEEADFSLVIYALAWLLAILFIIIYLLYSIFRDVRPDVSTNICI